MARQNYVVTLHRDGLALLLHMFGCAAGHARAGRVPSPVFLREAFPLSVTYFLKRD